MNEPVFRTQKLSVFSDDTSQTQLLDSLSVTIPDREITLLTGANGSGKTVLLRSLTGLQQNCRGNCHYYGKPLRDTLSTVRREVGFLFQNPLHQLLERTVHDDILLSLRYQGISRRSAAEHIEPLLNELELTELRDRDPYSLSTGEQRRTVIAGLLAAGAHTLLLDEPFTGLDYPGACTLIHQLLHLQQKGCCIVVCTHDLGKIIRHSAHCIVLESGRLRFEGTPAELIAEQKQDPNNLQLEPIISGEERYP